MFKKDWIKFQEFLIKIFLFIPKSTVENITGNLTDTNYFIVMTGTWIALVVFIWFLLWMTFKIARWF